MSFLFTSITYGMSIFYNSAASAVFRPVSKHWLCYHQQKNAGSLDMLHDNNITTGI